PQTSSHQLIILRGFCIPGLFLFFLLREFPFVIFREAIFIQIFLIVCVRIRFCLFLFLSLQLHPAIGRTAADQGQGQQCHRQEIHGFFCFCFHIRILRFWAFFLRLKCFRSWSLLWLFRRLILRRLLFIHQRQQIRL